MKRSAFLIALLACFQLAIAQTPNDTTSFEQPTTDIVIANNPGNLWQIGKPQKTYFNASRSATHAIVTDTINNYPPNDTSTFTYYIHNPYTQACYTCMEFWHKYDMDATGDKGLIDASYDGGNSWIALNDTNINTGFLQWQYDYHESNATYTGHQKIQGNSNGWIQSRFCWQWWVAIRTASDTIIINPDTLMIRFTFISDSVVKQKEGWMVDDLVASTAQPWECSGIEEHASHTKVAIQPNPMSDRAELVARTSLNNATITLINELGETVRQFKNISGTRIPVMRDGMQPGIYILKVSERNKIIATTRFSVID